MRLFTTFLALFGLVLGSQSLSAQGKPASGDHLYAFLRHAIADGHVYARCIRENDPACLRATPEEILKVFQMDHPSIGLKTVEALATYIDNLVVVPCPQIDVRMSGIEIPSRKIVPDWHRPLRPNEMCLADNNRGILIASLYCGNPFTDQTTYHAAIPYVAEVKTNDISYRPPPVRDTVFVKDNLLAPQVTLPSVPVPDSRARINVHHSFGHKILPYLIGTAAGAALGAFACYEFCRPIIHATQINNNH